MMIGLLECYLHLSLQPVVVFRTDVLAAKAAGVLELQAAFFVEPILQADGKVGLIPAVNLGIAVECFATGYDVECTHHGYGGGHVSAA